MVFTDTHAHLYLPEFTDHDAVVSRAVAAGIERIYLPNIDSSTINSMLSLCDHHPDHCFPMIGLHPCSVNKNYEKELAKVEQTLSTRRFYAIGEIGIDLYWDRSTVKEQQDAFINQVELACANNLPVIIHSRDSIELILDILSDMTIDKLSGIMHCFTGDTRQAERAIDLGLHLGVGGVLTFKNSGLDDTVKDIDLNHIVLETDAPYLAPVPHRGKQNESAYIVHIASKLAEVKACSIEEVAIITTENAHLIFDN